MEKQEQAGLDFSVEKFDPNVEQLKKMATEARAIQIKGLDDVENIKKKDEKRKELKKARVQIKKLGKQMRDGALKFQRDVIAKEKELIGIIEDVEQEIKAELDGIEEKLARERRRAVLPVRVREMKELEADVTEDELLSMDSKAYTAFKEQKKQEYQARKLAEEEDRLAAERKKIEDEKNRIAEDKRKLEEDKRVEEEKRKAAAQAREEERQRIEDEKREAERKEAEKAAAEAAEAERVRKNTAYQEWLKKNGVTNEMIQNKEVKIERLEKDVFALYKYVDTIVIQ